MLLDLLQNGDVLGFALAAAALLFSLTLHEFGHAFAADRLGDSTPRRYGRVTLNPIVHLDPIGTLLLLVAPFGFARPVPVNMARLGRWGGLIVAAAGPAANLLIALVTMLVLRITTPDVGQLFAVDRGSVQHALLVVLLVNLALALFNLLPIPLFDGSRILAALFPRTLGRSLAEFEQQPFAFIVVILFIFIAREPIFSFIRTAAGWLVALFYAV